MDTPTSFMRLQHSVVETDWTQPLTGGWSEHLGWFCFHFDDARWVWSPQVEQMHGYRPGTVSPGTELVLSHVHPDDLAHVAGTLRAVRRTPRPFSSRHRILDTGNRVHDVVVSGAPFYDTSGWLGGMQGSYVDMTPTTDGFALGPQSEYDRMAARLRVVSKEGHIEQQRQRVRAATRC
ncbi:PAS domain-containing protein [uncultured Mycobacterium sp.]|uniref:PAS domain-containing protein n=1 Tax=uncultured Mycobacterium sp. TaxID=171292 RepID=UPI0035C9E1A7